MNILTVAFSIQMLDYNREEVTVRFKQIKKSQIPRDVISAIGYPEMVETLNGILGLKLSVDRKYVKLNSKDNIYVAQYIGGRLLGENMSYNESMFKFYKVELL